jgi:putative phage-type endonuclease
MSGMPTVEERRRFLEDRRKGIGSSDVAAIADLDRYSTRVDVWLEKLGRHPRGDDMPEPAEAGIRLEPVVCQWAAERLDLRIVKPTAPAVHREHEWARANPDRLAFRPPPADVGADVYWPDDWGVVEAKAPGYWAGMRDWGTRDEPEPPMEALLQVQWQLEVADLEWGYAAGLLGGQRLVTVRVDRDREIGADLIRRAGEFWHEHVLAEVPPPVTVRDTSLLEAVYELDARTVVEYHDLDDVARLELGRLAVEYDWRRALAKEADDAKAEVGAELKVWLADHGIVEVLLPDSEGGKALASWKRTKPRKAKLCPHCQGVLAEAADKGDLRLHVAAEPGSYLPDDDDEDDGG